MEQRFRISPTGKGAVFRMKRWFYAFLNQNIPDAVKEESRSAWTRMVTTLIEEMNKRGAADKPARITLVYERGPRGEFVPVSVKAELFELRPVDTINLTFSKETLQADEKERVKSQLSELVKRAKELGVSVEELIKPAQELGTTSSTQ